MRCLGPGYSNTNVKGHIEYFQQVKGPSIVEVAQATFDEAEISKTKVALSFNLTKY